MEALGDGDPRQIGEYRLLRRLGAGGMGQVYLGRTAGGRTVAVKTVHAQYAADREFRVRFRNEVAAARRVGGRWTAPVLDADTEGPQPWVATGYVAGPSLNTAVRDFGPLTAAAVRSLGVGLAEALQAVHASGLVHRDVKPSNVLLALDGPRLIDFGITRALDAATALTRSGFVVGSPGYLSPEQAEGHAAGPASDVFSLGAVLAYAATGRAPFGSGVSAPVMLYRVIHEQPELHIPDPELHGIVADCLAKDPARRPTPAQLRARLAADDPTAGARLERRDWLPPAVAAALAALAVELLDLDGEQAAGPGRFGPPPEPWTAPPPPPTALATVPGPHVPGPPQHVPAPSHVPAQPYAPAPPPPGRPPAPTLPYPAQPQPARGRPGRTALLIAVPLAAAVAATAVYLGLPDDRPTGRSGGAPAAATTPPARPVATTEPTTPAATSPTAPAGGAATPGSASTPAAPADDGAVPAAFLGSWQGQLAGQLTGLRVDFTVTFSQGRVGTAVARIHNNSGTGTAYCDAVADLLAATADRVVLRTSPIGITAGCVADPHDQVYTRTADGSLHLTVSTVAGDLRKK
ncbi:serine/threonine-protein kinase [Kitasatospora sp. NPDC089797]|uniref:serine/threonine-protein kinase n=1 Tax=Kitasatospora sp. NPDC089797 TaxID=3155298 RepID=UPI003444AA39